MASLAEVHFKVIRVYLFCMQVTRAFWNEIEYHTPHSRKALIS